MMQRNSGASVNSGQSSQNVSCPMCSGTGVFSAYGNSSTCSGCQGTGYTTPAKAAKLRQALQQVDQMTGGGGYGGTILIMEIVALLYLGAEEVLIVLVTLVMVQANASIVME